MAITQAMCSSFKQQILLGEHDLDTDVIKLALYTSAATLSAATTVYSTSDEVVGTGYTAGGNTLAGATVSLTGTTAFVDFTDTTWSTATITARGALIYNSSKSDISHRGSGLRLRQDIDSRGFYGAIPNQRRLLGNRADCLTVRRWPMQS
jgi:hypothetical protein